MHKIILISLLSAVSLFAGNAEKLLGTWVFDTETYKASDDFKELKKQDQSGLLTAMILPIFESMELKITKTEFIMKSKNPETNQVEEEKTTYKIIKDEGKILEVEGKGEDGKEKKDILQIEFTNDKQMIFSEKNSKEKGPFKNFFFKKKE